MGRIRKVVFVWWPLQKGEDEYCASPACEKAIDAGICNMNKKKKVTCSFYMYMQLLPILYMYHMISPLDIQNTVQPNGFNWVFPTENFHGSWHTITEPHRSWHTTTGPCGSTTKKFLCTRQCKKKIHIHATKERCWASVVETIYTKPILLYFILRWH